MSGCREAYPLISTQIGTEQWRLSAQALDVPAT